MGSLGIALLNSAQAQRTFSRAISVVQTNVSNVSTPGYATQNSEFLNQPFNPDVGLPGGVGFGQLQDTRSNYAEQAVREQQGFLNQNQQLSTDLSRLNAAFDLNSQSAIPQTLSAVFSSFSQLAVNPNDPTARQHVLDTASAAAQSFRTTSNKLSNAVAQTDNQIQQTVDAINSDVKNIQSINAQRRNNFNSQHDAGLDAQLYAKLEDLSQYVNIQSLAQQDGTINIYIAGQTPVLVGTHQYAINSAPSQTAATIVDANQNDITLQATSGKLGALLKERNELLPAYTSNLNQLAQSFADSVNGQLRNGVDSSGASPAVDLFSYDPAVGNAASSLQVSAIQPGQIAAADPAAPGGNGNAIALAQLGQAKSINGLSFSQFYGSIAQKFGRDLSSAQQDTTAAQSLLSQSQRNREQISGVSLDQQAAQLIQFQQAYQAAGNLFRVLNQLTQDTINLIR